MIQTLKTISDAMRQVGLTHLLGDESLLGLSENNLERYRFNIVLYQLPISFAWFRYLRLGWILYKKKIIVKPKRVHARFQLKIRGKLHSGGKAPNFIIVIPFTKIKEQFVIAEKGREVSYPISAILPLDKIDYKNSSLPVPHDLKDFVVNYRTELLSSTYRKHDIVFDQKSTEEAENILFDIAEILNRNKNHWWLEGGTLLGLYRDGKLLDWDHDIDLGVRFDSSKQIDRLLKALRKTNYLIKVYDFPEKEGVWDLGKVRLIKIYPRRYYFFPTNLCLDLFIFYREKLEDTQELVYKYVVHQRNGYHPAPLLDELEDLKFKGHRLRRPKYSDEFLAGKYGENWEIPVKEWHVAIDDKTILNNMESL
ncbi:MAG: hypothetical protein HN657_06755 [Candidatus Marinimicrobia bacterium]|jgi:hypothetical protein|nr:hypothetical protein [Candidatus Neomarinimicrobiota bacterium]MBT3496199.1 hypothetical protein [Candidatus Neomarinimicrobiota bacterium]MBT3691693.1 hypothetical protein [Candidatus Neomarinimicrobiota bacterium]MBT3732210.1 hypothetical protein [Candidatus Neomarinimicrobiota bacterium]MBT4143658.1 hypothetical protein [Candidatus Neomarinimicrobiota bacterium]